MKNILLRIKQRFCTHTYQLIEMQPRNEQGLVKWPCMKCGKVWSGEYGLAVNGRIINSSRKKESQ